MRTIVPPALRAALCVLTLISSVPAAAQPRTAPLPADSLDIGRKYARWFMAGHADSVWAVVEGGGSAGIFASRESLANALADLRVRVGDVTAVIEERFVWRGANRQYWHTMRVTNSAEPIVLRLVLTPGGRIGGVGVNEANSTPPFDSAGPVIRRN